MKKTVLTLAVLVGFAMRAIAYDFCVDGIYYNGGYISGDPYAIVTFCTDFGCYDGDVVIPETVTYEGVTYAVTEIGPDAFKDCVDLISITIPTSVKHIDSRAFYGCTSLQDIHIPDWIQRIDATAFDNTRWYNEQPDNQPLYLDGWCMGYKGDMPLVELNIEEGTIAVADGAFAEYESLISVTLPNTLISLGYFVFNYCFYLRHVDFGESIEEIMYKAFDQCRSLDSVILPETVSRIGRYAFSNCVSLSHLILPNSITSIGAYAFNECINLNTVTLPNNLTEIENAVFEYSGLSTITIPSGVTKIGVGAFYNENLISATISETVMEIGRYSFGSPILDTVICLGSLPASLDNSPSSFETTDDAHLIVPCGSVEAYSNSTWSEAFSNISEDCGEPIPFSGPEWYYEIQNEDGSITYQYMYQAGDTIVQDEPTHILVKINTLYDKGLRDEVTHEYVYERDGKLYWWNKTLEVFTVLYDYEAEVGDYWEIIVGTRTLDMHVDAVEEIEYEGRTYRMLRVSDPEDLFSGNIVCGIGHLTSFFPERLMDNGDGIRVEGMRCYWSEGELVFKYGDEDCDAVYSEVHGIEEDGPSTGSGTFAVYPNPNNGVLNISVRLPQCDSPTVQTYRITNLMGQTLLTGQIITENQQIHVSSLPQGMYFITIAGETRKFVVR